MNIKFILKLFKGPIKRYVVAQLNDDELKKELVQKVNEKLDIPKLNEVDEAKLLDAIYEASVEAAVTAIERI